MIATLSWHVQKFLVIWWSSVKNSTIFNQIKIKISSRTPVGGWYEALVPLMLAPILVAGRTSNQYWEI